MPNRSPKLVLGLATAALLAGAAAAAVGLSAARAARQPLRPVPVVRYSGPVAGELIEDPVPMNQVLPEVNLDTMSLGRAIDALRRASGANIFVNWRRLKDAGLDDGPDTPVEMELRLKDATLGQALAKVLACAEPPPREGRGRVLGLGVRDGIITVSDDWADGPGIGRWYYVQDLLNDPGHAGFARPTPGPGSTTDQSVGPSPGVFEYGTTRQEREDQLVRIITESIDPESWRDAGGTAGSISSWAGRLIIQQTPENHQKVESLLANLRKGP